MRYLLFIILFSVGIKSTAQDVTFKVKKAEELFGLYYTKTGKKYEYLMFNGKEVSVWQSKEKPKNALSNADYKTFSKASIKTTEFANQDSLVTFIFKQNIKGRYRFLDYHCIVEDDGNLHVKISDTDEVIEVRRYKLVPKK